MRLRGDYDGRSFRRTACITPTCTMYYYLLWKLALHLSISLNQMVCRAFFITYHSTPAGIKFGRAGSSMTTTNDISERLVRLPLWIGLEDQHQHVLDIATQAI